MKKSLIISAFAAAMALGGCKDYLDQVPNDRITIEEVFKKKQGSEEYLANIYSYVPDLSMQWDGFPWVSNSDEMNVTGASTLHTASHWATRAPARYCSISGVVTIPLSVLQLILSIILMEIRRYWPSMVSSASISIKQKPASCVLTTISW
ncbi:hypothetical protein MKQ70_02850 [Chitinophaga sedimenti]|uniref:hypothetical protein n=1 Tax=Chitinophaga sedimenti TaxID=2033606 RepID=UPI0020036A9F|nr:hypothetical protein [Chitinophaga sedimenti]MCK7554003.1 hypothetical protein [Chitinophaga sedimenti]